MEQNKVARFRIYIGYGAVMLIRQNTTWVNSTLDFERKDGKFVLKERGQFTTDNNVCFTTENCTVSVTRAGSSTANGIDWFFGAGATILKARFIQTNVLTQISVYKTDRMVICLLDVLATPTNDSENYFLFGKIEDTQVRGVWVRKVVYGTGSGDFGNFVGIYQSKDQYGNRNFRIKLESLKSGLDPVLVEILDKENLFEASTVPVQGHIFASANQGTSTDPEV
jgi:hypothetical protein